MSETFVMNLPEKCWSDRPRLWPYTHPCLNKYSSLLNRLSCVGLPVVICRRTCFTMLGCSRTCELVLCFFYVRNAHAMMVMETVCVVRATTELIEWCDGDGDGAMVMETSNAGTISTRRADTLRNMISRLSTHAR